MGELYSWIKGIISYLCIFNILLQVLPTGNFRKYVRFFGGLLLIVLVMGPVAQLGNLSEEFERIWRRESLKSEVDEMEITGQGLEELRSEKINAAFEKEITRQIEELAKTWGLEIIRTELKFTENQEVLGLNEVSLRVSAQEGETEISEQIGEFQKELQEVYQISLEHIHISVQG